MAGKNEAEEVQADMLVECMNEIPIEISKLLTLDFGPEVNVSAITISKNIPEVDVNSIRFTKNIVNVIIFFKRHCSNVKLHN